MTIKEFTEQQIAKLLEGNKKLTEEFSAVLEKKTLRSEDAERMRSMAELLCVSSRDMRGRTNDLCQILHTEDERMASTFDDYKETA